MASFVRSVVGVRSFATASTSSPRSVSSHAQQPSRPAQVPVFKIRRHCLSGGKLEVSASGNRDVVTRAVASPPRRLSDQRSLSSLHGYTGAELDPYLS
eukprot:scaffold678051_cov57-Prasinocladus_malaysianus.AAC.1